MGTHHVSAFRPLAEDPLLSDGIDTIEEIPLFQSFNHIEAHFVFSNLDSAEPHPGYDKEHSPSDDLSYYIPYVSSVADERAPPPQSS